MSEENKEKQELPKVSFDEFLVVLQWFTTKEPIKVKPNTAEYPIWP